MIDAGYAPNMFQTSDEVLLEKYIGLARERGRFPVEGEIRRKARSDASFPNHGAFDRFGGKQKLMATFAAFCSQNLGIRGRPCALRKGREHLDARISGKATRC